MKLKQFFKRSSTKSFMDCEFTFDEDEVPLSAILGPEYMAAIVYKNCSAEVYTIFRYQIESYKFVYLLKI